jgi:hypothetical protein
MGFKEVFKNRSGLRVDNRKTTSAATLTLRQSLWPLSLVTILFFLWVCLAHLQRNRIRYKTNHTQLLPRASHTVS